MLAPLIALSLVTIAAKAGTPASSPSASVVDEVRAAVDAVRFEDALTRAERALGSGGLLPDDVAALHALAAQAAAGMGYADAAEASFGRALQLRPGFGLPATTSPRLLEPLRRARDRLSGDFLRAVPTSSIDSTGRVRTEVAMIGDVHRMVHTARVHVLPSAEPVPLARTDRFLGEWQCEQERCAYFVTLHDLAGNTLLFAGSREAPLFVGLDARASQAATSSSVPLLARPSPTDPAPRHPAERAWFARPLPYVLASGALAAAGTAFAWQFSEQQQRLVALNSNRQAHTLAEGRALDEGRRLNHTLMISTFLGAAGAGAVAYFVW